MYAFLNCPTAGGVLIDIIYAMLSHVDDHDEAARTAQTHGSGDHSLFSSALSFAHQNKVRHTGAICHALCSLRRSCVIGPA